MAKLNKKWLEENHETYPCYHYWPSLQSGTPVTCGLQCKSKFVYAS